MKTLKERLNEALGTDSNGKKWEEYKTIICPDGEKIDMQALLEEQARAKAALVHLAPTWGGLVSKLRFVYTFRYETQATDGYNIFVNPQFTNTLDFTEKVFVMAHEVMHCLLNHMSRGLKCNDHDKANAAADYEVNISLCDLEMFKFDTIKNVFHGAINKGLAAPGSETYIDKKFSGMGFETIYDTIPSPRSLNQASRQKQRQAKAQQNQGQCQNGGQGGGQGSGQGGQQQHSKDYIEGWKKAIEDYKAGKIKI